MHGVHGVCTNIIMCDVSTLNTDHTAGPPAVCARARAHLNVYINSKRSSRMSYCTIIIKCAIIYKLRAESIT